MNMTSLTGIMGPNVIYDRITKDEAQEIIRSISAFPTDDLVKIYLHMESKHDRYILFRKCFNEGDYRCIAKDIIIESILHELYSIPKEEAVTSINNNLKYYCRYRQSSFKNLH